MELPERLEIEEPKPYTVQLRLGARQLELIRKLRPSEWRVALVRAALEKAEPEAQ